jgi:exonuclease III
MSFISTKIPVDISSNQSLSNYLHLSNSLDRLVFKLNLPFHYSTEILIRNFTPITSDRLSMFGNHQYWAIELAKRVFQCTLVVLAFPVSISLFLTASIIDFLNTKNRSFSILKGNSNVLSSKDNLLKIFNLNTCMLWGGIPMIFGGVCPARYRIEHLTTLIMSSLPDVLVLQEMSRSAADVLWNRIKDHYGYAITSVSPQPLIMLDAGLFVASRKPISDIVYIDLKTNALMRRALLGIELPNSWILATHLSSGYEDEDVLVRRQQVATIKVAIEGLKKKSDKPVFLIGDLNIQRTFLPDDEYSLSGLEDSFINLDPDDSLNEETATCTNYLSAFMTGQTLNTHERELVDYALVYKDDRDSFQNIRFSKHSTYDYKKPLMAFSDHKALEVLLEIVK